MRFFQARREVLETARRMSLSGLSSGTSGNVSARVENGFLITPSGLPYGEMTSDDIVEMRADGSVAPGQPVPSSEWRIHRDIYSTRGEVDAIVHAHSLFCTTFACLRMPIPAVHYMIAVTGEAKVRCAPYATFGTQELSTATLSTLGGGKACLLANHGIVAVGASLGEALRIVSEVELVAQQYWHALQIGQPAVLSDEEIQKVVEKFRTYGQPSTRPCRR